MRPRYGPAEEPSAPHPTAELMLASSFSTRNGRNLGNPGPAPAVPVVEVSAQALEPAAHHR